NGPAEFVVILRHIAYVPQREVIISRGELIQIGGGFRIPEILEASGAKLREVGTTNKTALTDYAKAIGRETALILKVHRSNFFMGGFVESPATEEIAALARKKRIPFVEDHGSGATIATKIIGALSGLPLKASAGQGKSQIGGGTLPRSIIASVTLDLLPANGSLPEFAARLRAGTPPVIGYISGGRFKLDLRTIFPNQDEQ